MCDGEQRGGYARCLIDVTELGLLDSKMAEYRSLSEKRFRATVHDNPGDGKRARQRRHKDSDRQSANLMPSTGLPLGGL